jgi:4'-phosphopantetheinyl transferase EntD
MLPAGCAAFEWRGAINDAPVNPVDEVLVRRMAPKRRAEFVAGRACARAALADLGVRAAPLKPDVSRAPSWPTGFAGSITHTDGYCAAVTAPRTLCKGLGVDAERISRVSQTLWNSILTPGEFVNLHELEPCERQARVALTFSAKEAFFKAQHPFTGTWLEFEDVVIAVEASGFSLFCAKTPRFTAPIRGRFVIKGDLVLTAVSL